MPRPSLKDVRSQGILNAFVTCVARYGLEGATQERIAAEAGVKRTLLRHYLGNREDMVAALVTHVISEFDAMIEELNAALKPSNSIDALINLMFEHSTFTDPRLIMAYQALVVSVETYPYMREPLLSSMERYIHAVTSEVEKHYPKHTKEECDAIAQGLAALYVNYDALSLLNPPGEWREASKRAALLLVKNTGGDP